MQQTSSIRKAAFINMGARYGAALLQLAYSVILARLLTPDAFGLVAIAQVFVTFFSLFSDMGLGSAVVQRQDLEERDVSCLFGFSFVLAFGLGLLFALLGHPLTALYGREELLMVCVLLSASVFFSTMNTIPNSLLLKQQRFLLIGVRQIVSVLVASIIGICSALAGAEHLAIVIYSIASSLFIFLWNYLPNRIRPVFSGMMGSIRKVFSYSAYLFGFNLITYFSRNMDNLLVGYSLGAASLGNYSKAYQLMQLPQTYLTGAVTPVLHPILAKRQDEVDYIYDVFVKASKMLSLLGVFLAVFFLFSAEETVTVLYGEQWGAAVPCFQFLVLSAWSQMVCGASGPMFQVLNRTKLQFVRAVIIAIGSVGGAVLGVWMGGIESVALCEGVAYNLGFITLCPFLIRMSFGKSVAGYLKLFVPDAVLAALLAAFFAIFSLAPFGNVYIAFFAKLFIGFAFYAVLLVLFRQFKWIALLIPEKLRSRMPSRLVS